MLPVNPLGIYLSSAVDLKKFVPEYSLALVLTGCSPNLGGLPSYTMGKKVLPSILTAFKENNYDPFEATKEKEAGFDYLVSFDGNLFHIATDLSFIQSDVGLYGLGSGGAFALGYLYGVADNLTIVNTERHARKAMAISAVLDVNTHPPVQFVVQRRELS